MRCERNSTETLTQEVPPSVPSMFRHRGGRSSDADFIVRRFDKQPSSPDASTPSTPARGSSGCSTVLWCAIAHWRTVRSAMGALRSRESLHHPASAAARVTPRGCLANLSRTSNKAKPAVDQLSSCDWSGGLGRWLRDAARASSTNSRLVQTSLTEHTRHARTWLSSRSEVSFPDYGKCVVARERYQIASRRWLNGPGPSPRALLISAC